MKVVKLYERSDKSSPPHLNLPTPIPHSDIHPMSDHDIQGPHHPLSSTKNINSNFTSQAIASNTGPTPQGSHITYL